MWLPAWYIHHRTDLHIKTNPEKTHETQVDTHQCVLTPRRHAGVLSSVNIEEVNALDILGMRVSCDARWNDHIFRVAKEAFKYLGFFKRCRNYFTPSDLLTIYRTFIRTRLEYNSHVWVGASRSILKLIDRVQERAKVLY